jgi:hypothetical protein
MDAKCTTLPDTNKEIELQKKDSQGPKIEPEA